MPELKERLAAVGQIRHWAERGRLFAILDATDTPAVPIRARVLGDRAVSLYRGRPEQEWFAIAPYLVAVDAATLDWIASDLWTAPWGIFVLASATLEELRLHFRRFLVVDAPTGEQWYFRFYDPRVLVKFLPTCTKEQRTEFLGPVRAFGVTDLETYAVKVFSVGDATPSMPAAQPVVIRR